MCRYTVPWALFEERMPPTKIGFTGTCVDERQYL